MEPVKCFLFHYVNARNVWPCPITFVSICLRSWNNIKILWNHLAVPYMDGLISLLWFVRTLSHGGHTAAHTSLYHTACFRLFSLRSRKDYRSQHYIATSGMVASTCTSYLTPCKRSQLLVIWDVVRSVPYSGFAYSLAMTTLLQFSIQVRNVTSKLFLHSTLVRNASFFRWSRFESMQIGSIKGCCEHGEYFSGFIKFRPILGQLNNLYFAKKNYVVCK